MTGRPEKRPPSESITTDDPMDRLIERELAKRIEAPDMTRAIMGRLGYMRLSETAIQKRKQRKWMQRFATAACIGAVMTTGLLMHRHSSDSRVPTGPTLPAALHESLEFGGQQIERAIQGIRMFEWFQQPEAAKEQREIIREHRPELQRGNQQPFRWVGTEVGDFPVEA